MSARRVLSRIVALALVSVGGIVGMLLADGAWDALFLALSAAPLLFGAWRAYVLRLAHVKPVRDAR